VRKSIKGSKDSDSSLVSNENFSKTVWPSGWALGQATWAKMTPKLLHLWRHSQKICKPQPKNFCRLQSWRRSDSFEPLNSSLVQWFSNCGTRTSSGTRRLFMLVREQLCCHIWKALLFCLCVMIMLLIGWCAILILSTFEPITFFWNQVCTLQHLKNIRWYMISKCLRTTAQAQLAEELGRW